MTTITAQAPSTPAPERGAFGRTLRQLGIDTAYVLVGFPLGIAAFVILVTGISLGAGLLITLLGLPVLFATIYVARAFAEIERVRVPAVLRRPRVRARYKPAAEGWRKIVAPLGDVQSWLDVLHGIVRFPVTVAAFCVVFTWWVTALAGLTVGLWDWAIPRGEDNTDLPELLGLGSGTGTRIVFYTAAGLFAALTLPLVVRACALAEAWLAYGMLNGVAGLRGQVAELAGERAAAQAQTAAAVSAEATALRRLERDIHDGPQQRLVRLAVDLGRAQHQLDSGSPGRPRRRLTRPSGRRGRPWTSSAPCRGASRRRSSPTEGSPPPSRPWPRGARCPSPSTCPRWKDCTRSSSRRHTSRSPRP